mmetsp:Transcript_16990/g.51557  ORF Transcript_16990/g.51557 Transcript_16990/m.51557 type:complete len:330 (-) Transcript_16990:203-1192(-)
MPRIFSSRSRRAVSIEARSRPTAARASDSMRSRLLRSTSASASTSRISPAFREADLESGSRRHASNADANAGSPSGSPSFCCALTNATAAAELFAFAAPLTAVPNVTAVGAMDDDSIVSSRSRTSPNRPPDARLFSAMLYDTTLSATFCAFISASSAVVAFSVRLPRAACRSALYVERGTVMFSAFIRRHSNIAVLPLIGRARPHAAMAPWYIGAFRRASGKPSTMAYAVRWSPALDTVRSATFNAASSRPSRAELFNAKSTKSLTRPASLRRPAATTPHRIASGDASRIAPTAPRHSAFFRARKRAGASASYNASSTVTALLLTLAIA